MDKLANNEELGPRHKNHKIINDKYYKNCYKCHIQPGWLLIYQYDENKLILSLVNTGNHSKILNK